jgi:uncharacterized protein (TIGR03083 family)
MDSRELWLAALHNSHRGLVDTVAPLNAAEVSGPSYDSEWSIAQVLSHLGSGAEIFSLFLAAGLDATPVPGVEQFGPVWEQWNAKAPVEQVRDALETDAALLEQIDALNDGQRAQWRMPMFGAEQDLGDLLRLRLGEHAVHTWDVAVTRDAQKPLAPDATELLIDHLAQLVARTGQPPVQPLRVLITTEEPVRHFLLHVDSDKVELHPQDDAPESEGSRTLRLRAEALIRLVYGRLDPEHTPAFAADGVDLNDLRPIFPGF